MPTVLCLAFICNSPRCSGQSTALQWDSATLQGVRDAKLGAPMASRALAVVHTCMYDAWAAYDERAVGTQLGDALRRPLAERTLANKQQAVSFAAYRALADLLPGDKIAVYDPLMRQLGYDPRDDSTDIETPAGIGNVACAAVLEFRHHDNSNQLGDLAQGAYSDWTGYKAVNRPSRVPAHGPVADPNRWQPLIYENSGGEMVSQQFLAAHWGRVTPFALTGLPPLAGPALYGSPEYREQAEALVAISAGLTDRQKMISEYWTDGPNTEQPPGHWARLAQWVSARDRHTLDDDVKMFFALTNAMMDAGIATWQVKRQFDSVRPATAIPLLFKGQAIRAWGGPGKGTVTMDGADWIPYQLATSPTPPFPDYVSGHSAYSAGAAFILASWTGSDRFGDSVTLPAGSSAIESGVTPAAPVILSWATFSDAAEEAGMSRRYGGIHFARADLDGRQLGRFAASSAWSRASGYFAGEP